MKQFRTVLGMALMALLAGGVVGTGFADKMGAPMGKDVTITGYVRDPGCLLKMGMKGEKHAMCAAKCAEMGQTLAIEDEQGNLHVALASKEGGDPNEKIKPFVEQRVTVKGKVVAKGGLSGITVLSVEKAK